MPVRRTLSIAAVALLPALAFVLHDFVFQLPDNQHEASLGFFAMIGGLLLTWAAAGDLAARGRPSRLSALGTAAIAAAASVAALWVVFVALNLLFPERMSYEPDRLRFCADAGYATLRDCARGEFGKGVGPFPLLMGIAVLAGAAGGARRYFFGPAVDSRPSRST